MQQETGADVNNPGAGKDVTSDDSSITVANGYGAALTAMKLDVNVDDATIKINDGTTVPADKGKLYVNSVSPKIIGATIAGAGLVRDDDGILSVNITAGGATGTGADVNNPGAGKDVTSDDSSITVANGYGAALTAMKLDVNVDDATIKINDGTTVPADKGKLYVNSVSPKIIGATIAGAGLVRDDDGILSVNITAGGATGTGADVNNPGAGKDVTSDDSSITVANGYGAALTAMKLDVNVDDATIKINDGTTVPADKGKLYVNSVSPKIIGATIAGPGITRDPSTGILSVDITGTGTGALAGIGKDVSSTDGSITGGVANAVLAAMDLEVKVDNETIKNK